jgi:DNA replication and repair protein RecF
MRINALSLFNFRNHAQLNLKFTENKTTIVGRNGRGKTNIVEAVNYFATLGSHRVASDQPLIKHNETSAQIVGLFEKHQRAAKADITINQTGSNKVLLNNSPLSKPRDLLGLVNTVVFAPEDLSLVKGDPSDRRKYLDDFSVLLLPKFSGVRHEYERTLKQRNALLKSAGRRTLNETARTTLEVWDEQLINYGTQIVQQRLDSLKLLTPFITEHGATLSGAHEPLEINYAAKWLENTDDDISTQFKNALADRHKDEIERGVTLVGPHRDELEISLSAMPAKGYASHGQSWSIALAMRLATFNVLREHDDDPILILDDVFAELDQRRRTRLLEALTNVEQTLITAAVVEDLPEGLAGEQILLEDN